jgi:diguanylate cyclase (GGDEF)-like protein
MAAIDRCAAAGEREEDALDELTRALRRGPGIVELKREVARARRTKERFVVAFVDVVGLKEVNDSLGHGAGDDLLQNVVRTMRSCLREYDLIVRYGGDEFVCALAGLPLEEARRRFNQIDHGLGGNPGRPAITAGITELIANESLPDLIGRADADLLEQRRRLANVHRT